MQALTRNHTTPLVTIDVWYLDSFEDSAWLPDGQSVTYWQAYDPLTNRPVGPRGGDPNPAYVRLWMQEHHAAALECAIVSVQR